MLISSEQHDQLNRGAHLRRRAAEYVKAWDAYFAALARGADADYSAWQDLARRADEILNAAAEAKAGDALVRQGHFSDHMSHLATLRHTKKRSS